MVVYTGSRSPNDKLLPRQNNANGYLVKPMGAREMDETIGKLREILLDLTEGSCSSDSRKNKSIDLE